MTGEVILAQLRGGDLKFLAGLQVLAEVQMPAEPVERCFGQEPEVCQQGHSRQRSPQLFEVVQQIVLNEAVNQFLLEGGDGIAADSVGHVEEVNALGGEFGLCPGKLIQHVLYLPGIRDSLSRGRGDRTRALRSFLREPAARPPPAQGVAGSVFCRRALAGAVLGPSHDQGALFSPHPGPLPFGRGEGNRRRLFGEPGFMERTPRLFDALCTPVQGQGELWRVSRRMALSGFLWEWFHDSV